MPRNLRSVIELVTRGGRSVVSRRNFSSFPGRNVSEGSGDSVAYNVGRLLSFAAGYGSCYYYAGTLSEVEEDRQKNLRKDGKGESEEIAREKIKRRLGL